MKKNGFTLIELLAVILILGIIALIAIPTVNGVIEESRQGAKENSGSNLISKTGEFCISAKLNKEEPNLNILSYESEEYPTVESLIGIKGDVPSYDDFLQYDVTDGCDVKVIYEIDGYKCSNQLDSDGNVTYSVSLDNTTADKVTCEKTDTSVFVNQTKILPTDGTKHVLRTYYMSDVDFDNEESYNKFLNFLNSDFRSDTYRNTIYEIEFTNNTTGAESVSSDMKWDVSEAQDGSIIAWLEPISDGSSFNKLYIGSTGTIYANSDSSGLFSKMENVTKITFGNFNTSDVVYMEGLFSRDYSLTSLDVSSFDMTNVIDMYSMFYNCTSLKSIDITNFKLAKPTDISWMFGGDDGYFMSLEEIKGIDKLNTSNVIDMCGMFYNDIYIKKLDLSKWDTSKVTDMSWMFASDYEKPMSLDEITGVERLNISNVTDISGMFFNDQHIKNLNLNKWDTSNVTDMNNLFGAMNSLESLNLSKWNTSKVTNMTWMFGGDINLQSLDLSGWDTSKVTNMSYMFSCFFDDDGYVMDYMNLKEIKGIEYFNTSKVTNMSNMFTGNKSLTSLNLSNWNTSKVTNMYGMFYGDYSLINLDLSGWDTSNVTKMTWMFGDNINLQSLDLSGWDTSKVTDMYSMFAYDESLTTLNIGGFDTSNVKNMAYMFYDLESLTFLDLSSFDTSKVTNMCSMFAGYSWDYKSKISEIKGIENFKTGNVEYMCSMFANNASLKSLDLSKWDTSKVTNMHSMFGNSTALESINISTWNMSNVTDIQSMFCNTYALSTLNLPSKFVTSKITNLNTLFSAAMSLESLDISGWDTSNVTSYNYTFNSMKKLTSIDASKLNVSKATNINAIFHDTAIASLDLSTWNTSNVTTMYNSFGQMKNLTTIYVGSGWNISKVTNSKEMFKDDTKLVGAVSYDSSKIDKTMANYTTGYLTLKS